MSDDLSSRKSDKALIREAGSLVFPVAVGTASDNDRRRLEEINNYLRRIDREGDL